MSCLDKRAKELNNEMRNRSVFNNQRQPAGSNVALQDRVLILELSQLVGDFLALVKNMQHDELKAANEDTPGERIDVDLLDDDSIIAGSSTSQVCLILTACMRQL